MRAVSFVDRIEFECPGNLLKDSLVVGDVDNDLDNELVVGNANGDIMVFKGFDTKPWKTASVNGMIAAIAVGDILNENKNFLVTITGEGWCNIFCVNKDGSSQGEEPQYSRESESDSKQMTSVHIQRLMANTKIALLSDIDGDGSIELVIGMSDRVVRSYRWTRLFQFYGSKSGGRLVAQNKWEFANQIGTVTLNTNEDGTASLLVAQPGGTYIQLNCYSSGGDGEVLSKEPLEYHALSSTKMRNSNVSTEIVGNIRRLSDGVGTGATLHAVATLDGTLMLLDREQTLWSLQVNHQLFSLTKLDVTENGDEEVVACAWDGQTYIVNHENQAIRFQFDDTVSTFTAGYYAVEPGRNAPCLVYGTFSNRVYLYYNIFIPQITTSSLISVMESRSSMSSLLDCLHADAMNFKQLQQLNEWLLYGSPHKAFSASVH